MVDFYTLEQRRAYNRAYYARNKAGILAAKHKAYKTNRFFWTRSLRHGRGATAGELWSLWHKQRGRCALTGARLTRETAHLDHRVPRSKGGANTVDNLQWVHDMANRAKHTRTDEQARRFFAEVAEDALKRKYGVHYIIPFIRRLS